MNRAYIVIRTYFLLLFLLLSCTLYGQPRNNVGTRLFDFDLAPAVQTSKQNNTSDLLNTKNPKTINDTVRYASIVKQHGWYRGIGKPLTKEHASHLPVHYRMTQKNEAGHWTHLEAIDGYGNLTTSHGLSAYAIHNDDEGDTLANKEWVEKMGTICQWDFVYEGKGEKCLIERAYNEKGELIFAFTPVQINDSVFIGTYLDDKGRPANLRGDKGASLVRITRNEKGYDSQIELLDENGYNIKNQDGVIMSKYYYDEKGHYVKYLSCNAVGDPVLDDWGNCGVVHLYDEKDNVKESFYINQYGQPIPMPENNRNRNGNLGVTRTKYEYDKWGRAISASYFDKDNNLQVNQNGVHRFEKAYNEHGLDTYRKWFDINNKPTPIDSTGICSVHFEYNNKGKGTLYESFDRNGNYLDNADETCKAIIHYFADNTTMKRVDNYTAVDGNPVLNYVYYQKGDANIKEWYYTQEEKKNNPNDYWYEEIAPTYKLYKYNNGVNTVDSIDNHQNTVCRTAFYEDGSPAMIHGSHIYQAKYNYIDEKHYEFIEWRKDTLDNFVPIDNYGNCINVQSVDMQNWVEDAKLYNAKGLLVASRFRQYGPDWNPFISETACNFVGVPSRNDHAGVEYLKTNISNNLAGGISAYVIRNEFDEPAYIFNGSVYYYTSLTQNNTFQYYDEDSKLITNMDSLTMNMPYATVIEVYDSLGYQHGFKDNDVIVQYGDWYYPLKSTSNRNSSLGLLLEMIKKKNESKSMTILRYYPETGKSEVLQKEISRGGLSDYGVNIHVIPYTRKELERLRHSLGNHLKGSDMASQWKDYVPVDSLHGYQVKIGRPKNSGNCFFWNEANVRDPYLTISTDTLGVNDGVPEVKMAYTTDFRTFSELTYRGLVGSWVYWRFYISDEDKKKLLELNKEINKE